MATAQTHLQQGLNLATQSQWQQAIDQWQQAITIEPDLLEAHFNMGIAFRKLGKTQEAIAKYEQTLTLNPNHALTHFSLGNILFERHELSQALDCYSMAVKLEPRNSNFYFQLGLVCHRLGQISKSIQCFEKVLEISPDRQDAQQNLGKLLKQYSSVKDWVQSRFEQGLRAYDEDKLDEAILLFQEVLQTRPDYIPSLYNLALIYKKKQQLHECLECLTKIVDLNPKHLDAHKLLAGIYISRGEPNKAMAHYLQAIALSPDDRWIKYSLRAAEWQLEIQKRLKCDPQTSLPKSFSVLHVGCGPYKPFALAPLFRNPAWREIRLDIDPSVNPDVIGSITDLSGVSDDSIDALYSSHNLEHIFRDEVPVALAEFFRVLKPGGLVLITLPDLQAVAKFVAEGRLEEPIETYPGGGKITAIHAIYGEAEGFMLHKTGFTPKTLQAKLENAGFQDIVVCSEGINLWAKGYKGLN